jgi:transcriptional regulator with XRE-family HTH domain
MGFYYNLFMNETDMIKSHETFCDNIKRLRRQMGITQQELADKIGCSRPYIAELEAGRNAPTLTIVDKVAAALDCQPSVLLIPHQTVESIR